MVVSNLEIRFQINGTTHRVWMSAAPRVGETWYFGPGWVYTITEVIWDVEQVGQEAVVLVLADKPEAGK